MNSRGSVNEIVNFSTDLATLNQLDVKEPLLSFPFDHLYACHSESGDQSQTLVLDKEVEISTHCVVAEDSRVTRRLASLESQNKKLKDLLIYHLDLIQQQNDFMSKREKVFQALKQENDTLKSKVTGLEQNLPGQRQVHVPMHVAPTATITSGSLHNRNVASTSSTNIFDTFNELLVPQGITNQYNIYNSDLNTNRFAGADVYDYVRSDSDLVNYLSSELGISPILESSTSPALPCETFTMIDNKKPSKPAKKDVKPVEVNTEPKYTVTTDTGNPKYHRNRKTSTGIGSFSRMAKTIKPDTTKPSDIYDNADDAFNASKKAKTYGNTKQPSKYMLPYTKLSGKLQLIDPIPPGADPYQLGEAEMRAQSPIPKLMLQNNNQGRMRIYSDSMSGVTSTVTSASSSRRVYDTMSGSKASEAETYGMVSLRAKSRRGSSNTMMEEFEPEIVKPESDLDWNILTTRPRERSLCDFSYGETSANLLKNPLDISKMSFNEIFDSSPVNADSSNTEVELAPEKNAQEKAKRKRARTTSLAGPSMEDDSEEKRTEGKRGRKRALSTAGTVKRDNTQKATNAKPRARRAIRDQKTPVPGMSTQKLYHTCMGDPDLSWYLGLNPDIKKEDCENTDNTASNVEVPRWRLKSYSPVPSPEATENMDDKIFEKRHQKLEAEERRQLRWHMRRIREQRHVERLRQRQRDPWAPSSSQSQAPSDYTVWPQPNRDLEYIEITETLPVLAFGEEIPVLPEKSYVVPWVLSSSKVQKRSKRSKTLR